MRMNGETLRPKERSVPAVTQTPHPQVAREKELYEHMSTVRYGSFYQVVGTYDEEQNARKNGKKKGPTSDSNTAPLPIELR